MNSDTFKFLSVKPALLLMLLGSILAMLLLNIEVNAAAIAIQNTEKTIQLSNNMEFTYHHFEAKNQNSDTVALWISSRYQHQRRFMEFSQRLSNNGIEVWMVSILDNLFMQKGANSQRQLTGKYVAELIKKIHKKTNKKVVLLAQFYSAIPVLRGAHQWQLTKPSKRYLTGAVLFSPNLFEAIPALGEKPKFVDVVNVTTIPILLLQSQKSSTRGQLPPLLSALQNNNAAVFTTMLKNSIALFYSEDKTPETLQYLDNLPKLISSRLSLLEASPLPLFNKTINHNAIKKPTLLDSNLKKYRAKNLPHSISLKDVYGKNFIRNNYKNKITIINFWATWCKPCLEEIPSLNRLQEKMKGRPFEIISINYAEKPETIRAFMKSVKIDFPILID